MSPSRAVPLAAAAVLAGDPTRFREIVGAFDRSVRRIVARTVRDAHAVEDVVQEVWLLVYRQVATLLEVRRADAWIARIARNRALDWRRQCQRRAGQVPLSEPAHPEVVDDWVWELVAALPAAQRDLLGWRYREALTYREIAQRLGVETSTVRGRLYDARQVLRGCIERRRSR